jgi:hypothetical protein
VLDAAGQAVGSPNQDNIKLVALGVVQHLIQARPAGLGPAEAVVGVNLNDGQVPLRGQLL